MIRKVLKFLHIIQSVSNEQRTKLGLKKLGRGFFEAHRINPFNPLSYLFILLCIPIAIIMFGLVGIWEQIDKKNPFKWD